jgi:protease-4
MAFFGCVLVVSLGANLMLFGLLAGKEGGDDSPSKLREVVVSGKGEQKAVVLDLRGMITDGVGAFNEGATSAAMLPMIRKAKQDKLVKGILMVANSPGGSVTASDTIYHALRDLAKTKPVVAIMGDTCASGCVYITAAATQIVAHPTTITGSIGVIVSTLNFSDMLDKVGIKGISIASKKNKALLSPLAPVQEEHKQIIKGIVDQMYHRFVGIVAEGRKRKREEILPLADGRVFLAEDALKHKLIDKIGYRKDAEDLLLKLLKLPSVRFVSYRKDAPFLSLLTGGVAKMDAHLSRDTRPSIQDLLHARTPRVWYIWPTAP